ncbi:MAG TPA: phosphoribosylformylglycinamidine synthase subunit PurL [Ignavibacteria bacterium]|nr:phosphoribosylformylglycinamidine synthase subunit PurL [Bacteroidota bacterium]HRE11171.1 phosphoribosylformylglycinamidine synthase subunit PurL [Ignavibacteria bacterium]HRF64787.1 phosphoribosylformylglycinamidine synthase subunit PurL [Ignavibacteria bacterium]HRJ05208.1 phosphoribosylformylglycinamidine synthase subunit PurL [Ignavibacteria bacterium]
MNEPEVTLELAKTFGLTEEEYNRILDILDRKPSYTELGIYSVMWSEHCSYKNSILEIKKLPRSGGRLLVGAGEENAGLVDIGDGLAVAFKIESHNHPSAVEPYQGAATGVGGILRDIFTMGARPIAALNSLRFGSITTPPNPPLTKEGTSDSSDGGVQRTKFLFKNVVKGIGDYGNCFGVPTVGGEIYFDESYRDNPLVNAMAVGIVKHDEVAKATAKGVGNPVFIVGSSTGRDGIHGATFASEEISEASEAKRPSVQVGDPFTEKLLLEASLELIKSGVVVGMQDMGAAGITCSTSEMSAKDGMGMDINLDFVPAREENMSAYELMLSESQERMLVVIQKGKEDVAKKIFDKWDLNCVEIGTVTQGPNVKIIYHGKVMAEVPANTLVLGGDAPVYVRESKEPAYLKEVQDFDQSTLAEPKDLNTVLINLLSTPNITNKNWVYEQYDTQVRTNTVIMPGGDASVVRIKGTKKALAMKTDCNGRYVYLNPYKGAMTAVCESARNVACTGAIPLAITNCLNFGNPYKPEVYHQFREAIRGIGDACKKLDTPVTGGNVSFYNESPDYAVYPTPTIGMVGLIENIDNMVTSYFKNEGDIIAVIGNVNCSNSIGGSEYLKQQYDLVKGDAPEIDLEMESNLVRALIQLANTKSINSAHDVSDGGLAVCIAESCMINRTLPIGCSVNIEYNGRPDFWLFNESQGRAVISFNSQNEENVKKICNENNIVYLNIGKTGGEAVVINKEVKIPLEIAKDAYYNSISQIMEN